MHVDGAAWVLEVAGAPLVRRERSWGDPGPGLALLEVRGCGVCHTDLGYADGSVAPRAPLPLVLGHEVVGRVLAVGTGASESLVGRLVLAPAVSPCKRCAACVRGRATSCTRGRMPGNDADGAFATHTFVPAHDVVALPEPTDGAGTIGRASLYPWQLAPISDAATTAEQALERAKVVLGDVAIFVGAGGVGGFGAQLARLRGARVIAIDRAAARLEALATLVDETIDASGLEARDVRARVRETIERRGWSGAPVRVFETSGTPAGQKVAFDLLTRGGSLSVVGFTPEAVSLRLSNVMALDAEVFGNWGCDPALYGGVVSAALEGALSVAPFVEARPLDEVNDVLERMHQGALQKRVVLVPATGATTPQPRRTA
ncbi:MAG: alcohol dehydrogenase catalytic domain-containing protein [Deltaproteobacteria bacterium]|nr:alcohol dehydrogenase catalytic domain-containing protein [Deltaproteobacteria bacterium]